MRWFRAFVPSLAEPYRLRIAGTALHESSLIMNCVKSDRFRALVVPIERTILSFRAAGLRFVQQKSDPRFWRREWR
jgi:hypothetical protein